MNRCLPILAVLAGCALARAEDPNETWERAVKAKGGRERLHAVHSLAIYLKPAALVMPGPPTNWLCVFPSRYVEFAGTGSPGRFYTAANGHGSVAGSPRVVVVDGTSGRVAMDANGAPRTAWRMGPVEHERLILNQLLFLLETESLHPEPSAVRHNLLTVQVDGHAFQISLDRADLPQRIQSVPKHQYDYRLQQYRDYQGIWLPSRITYTTGMRQFTWDADYEVDAKYNPKIFERMPDLADGPEPWRHK